MPIGRAPRRLQGLRLLLLLLLVRAPQAEAATAVFYSVGTSGADLKTGSPTITISAGTATFNIAQAANVGVGDEITYNGATRAYISGRLSAVQYTVTTATGATPADVSGLTVNAVRRAFNSLSAAEANSSNATHLNTLDLVGADIQLNWPCYNDSLLNDLVQISGYATGPTNYIRVYTPKSSSEVGVSQRHRGILGTGFQINRTNGDIIQINDAYVRIEGLTLQATVTSAGWFGGVQSFPAATSDVRISHNVIKGVVTAGNPAYGIMVGTNSANVHRVWDNVVYGFTNTGSENGLGIDIDDGIAYVFNNTVYNCQVGILRYSTVAGSQVRNNVSINYALNATYADYLYLNTAPAAFQTNNVSSDATAAGAGSQINKTSYAAYFRATNAGSEDLHLNANSLALWGSSGANLSSDPNLPVTDDVDGNARFQPDIGADEFDGCCDLVTTEGAGTVTVTATSRFELGFNEALGGGIDKFYDLVEDPLKATDLVGGVNEEAALLGLELQSAPASVWYETDQANAFSKAQLLEATPTRVRVRQESFLTDTGPVWLPGSKAIGDHSIYGTGRSALRWTWLSEIPITYYERDVNLSTHWTGTGNPQFKPCEEGKGCWTNLGTGPEDFVLQAWNLPTKRTDFLTILSTDWAQATDLQSFGQSGAPDDWWWSGWIQRSGTPSTPATQSWNLLTYFKPTNFADDADTAVTSRSTDYRTPSGLTVLTGGPWQLASENTGGGDAFNEAEGAYVLTLDPANGAIFRIDGSVAVPRYQPFFKLREWRSLSGPTSITLQGAPLTAGAGFRADVKPISRAHFANALSWHSTLESAAAVTTPDVGSAGSVTGGVTFVDGRYGNAGSFVAPGDYVTSPFTNFNIAIGTVEFWYRPNYDCQPAPLTCDGVRHTLWIMEGDATHFFTVEKTLANRLDFAIRNAGTTTVVRVALPDFGWRANDWVHIRAMWNDVAPAGQTMRLFVNEEEPAHLDVGGDYNAGGMPVGPTRIGGDSAAATTAAGLIDEFHIYRGGVTPTRFGYAGLAAHVDEYLAVGTPARNIVLLTTGVDPSLRGQYVYFGADSEFRGLNVALATPGDGVADDDLVWEYWNGTAWTSIESVGFTDETLSLKRSGTVYWQDPPTWTLYSVNGGPDLYYVRIHLPATTFYSTFPVEGLIKTDILLLQYCGNITAAAQEFTIAAPVPTAVKLSLFSATARDSAVDLSWETSSEIQNLGFHIHRSQSGDGPFERITSSVIPGLGSSPHGASYRYTDSGVSNGSTYFYKLEDIETTGRTTLHGPVSATPFADASLPTPVPSSLVTYGEPEANGFRVLRKSSEGAVLELTTEGFYAEPQGDGTVRLSIPGFESLSELSLPVLRPWVEALAGRNVVIASVQASAVESFTGFRPAPSDAPEIVATRAGTVRAGRRPRRSFLESSGLIPEEAARLLQVGFQGDAKKAQLELAPLRWNGSTGELLFARRLTVHLAFRGKAADGRSSRQRVSRGAGSLRARLATTERGLYEVRYEDVFRARRSFALDQLRLSRLGVPVSFHVEPSGRFAPGSKLYFLGGGSDVNPYGAEAVYELELEASGRVMDLGSASPSGEELPFYLETDAHEENRLYQAGLPDAPDVWLWELLLAPSTKSFPFEVNGLRSGSSNLTVWLQGVSDFDADPDHHLRLFVNGALQHEAFWNGKEPQRLELVLGPGTLREGENRLEIENVGDTEAQYSMVMLDKFHVVYPRIASAEEGNLEGVWTLSGTASVSGLGPSHLLDVTNATPRWLSGAELSAAGSLRFRAETGRSYLAVSYDAVHRPLVRNAAPPRLGKDDLRADYLVIAPREFSSTAAPLLAHRARQGLRAKLVALEDVYDEFGFGERRPEAIRDFVSYAYHHWREPKLRYVLLVGDSTYDFKDYLQTGVVNQLPPLMVKTSYLWTVSDPAYAAVNGNDLLPDVAIGRLPAKDPEELRAMVSKILDYEAGEASLERTLVLVTDDADRAGDFRRDAAEIAAGVLSGRPIRSLSLEELGDTMRSEILRAFDEGASLVSYAGHGGIHLWADENVWNNGDVASLSPQPQQPLLLTMNCLNGYFHFPYFDSLAETLLKAESKGAVAAFSPSGLSLNEPAHRFHVALLDAIFNQGHQRLGDAVLAAQEDYAGSGVLPELLSIYHLLGDPGLNLR